MLIALSMAFAPLRAQQVSASYSAETNTLTLKSDEAPISKVLSELALVNLDVFISDLDSDFPVKANFTNAPVDEVLSAIIPPAYHYFYRMPEKAIAAAPRAAVTAPPKQRGEKRTAEPTKTQAPAASLQNDVSKFNLNPGQGQVDNFQKVKTGAGVGVMSPAAAIKAGTVPKAASAAKPILDLDEEHLVVTFKITPSGLEAVAGSFESGAYTAADEHTSNGDHVLLGRTANAIVYAEAFDNPLRSRSIFDPAQNTYHKDFELKEAYITVKMPKTYANPVNTKGIKLEVGRLEPGGLEAIFSTQEAAADVKDLRKFMTVDQSGNLDLSRIKIKGN